MTIAEFSWFRFNFKWRFVIFLIITIGLIVVLNLPNLWNLNEALSEMSLTFNLFGFPFSLTSILLPVCYFFIALTIVSIADGFIGQIIRFAFFFIFSTFIFFPFAWMDFQFLLNGIIEIDLAINLWFPMGLIVAIIVIIEGLTLWGNILLYKDWKNSALSRKIIPEESSNKKPKIKTLKQGDPLIKSIQILAHSDQTTEILYTLNPKKYKVRMTKIHVDQIQEK